VAETMEVLHFHLFCGLGGGARGFNRGRAELNGLRARFRCIGGVDVSPASIRDFNKLAGVPGTVLDLFDREQYIAFHGCEPPADWREATTDDIKAAAHQERPNIVFLSAPCKGFSGLLSESRSKTAKYQALNRLTLRGVWLMLEAWGDDPPELILFENVPRIATRGRALLDQIGALLRRYGYAIAENFHDCGELGGLGQSRKRFLLVARHLEKVPPFLYEPPRRALRAVGDVLGRLPMPGDIAGGPMHALPNLQWKTWVRLAFVEAGSDWRSLNKLRVVDGKLADYLLMPEYGYSDVLGVLPWQATAGTVTGGASATRGRFSVGDPRFEGREFGQFGVRPWNEASGTVTSQRSPGQGCFAVADTRATGVYGGGGKYVVTPFDSPSNTVIAQSTTGHGSFAVADPRCANYRPDAHENKLRIVAWDHVSRTVTGGKHVQSGLLSVADPRLQVQRTKGDNYLTAGHYGVVGWDQSSGAVSAAAGHDNGRWNVADPRLPEANEKLVAIIRLVDPDELLDLDGSSDSAKRERIGNAVPPGAAQAIADLMGQTLLLAWSGQSFALSSTPVWVQPVAVALSVRPAEVGRE